MQCEYVQYSMHSSIQSAEAEAVAEAEAEVEEMQQCARRGAEWRIACTSHGDHFRSAAHRRRAARRSLPKPQPPPPPRVGALEQRRGAVARGCA